MLDWSSYPNFSPEELACSHCGEVHMDEDFMNNLQAFRTRCGFPFVINSGYRCDQHPAELRKGPGEATGEHVLGKAVDIGCSGWQARAILRAPAALFPRVGVKQHGPHAKRFIHLGSGTVQDGLPSPFVWSYE